MEQIKRPGDAWGVAFAFERQDMGPSAPQTWRETLLIVVPFLFSVASMISLTILNQALSQ